MLESNSLEESRRKFVLARFDACTVLLFSCRCNQLVVDDEGVDEPFPFVATRNSLNVCRCGAQVEVCFRSIFHKFSLC